MYDALISDPVLSGMIKDRVYFFYPPIEPEYPLITYHETGNKGELYADNSEIAGQVTIAINIMNDGTTTEAAIEVNRVMEGIGFYREMSADMNEDGILIKAMRFKTIREVQQWQLK